MHSFRKKSYTYQSVPTLCNEDGEGPERASHGNDEPHPQPSLSRAVEVDKIRHKRSQSLFLLFFLLVTYILLSVLIPSNWIPFESSNDTSNGLNMIPSLMDFGEKEKTTLNISEPSVTLQNNDKIVCKIPKLDPFEHSIRHLVKSPKFVDCTKKFPLLFRTTLNSTLVTLLDVKGVYRNVSSCCYQALVRGNNKKDPDNSYSFLEKCTPLNLEYASELVIPPEDEYIAITCKILSDTKLEESKMSTTPKPVEITHSKIMDLHAFVHRKPAVESRVEKYYNELLKSKNWTGTKPLLEKDRLNVVILGIDAVSHMNFIRTMPRTHSFLMKELSAVEMKGFNKIGDNTFPNLAAGLTSLNKSTMESTCEEDGAFDKCPFIWQKYAKQGYRTSYGEDSTWMGIFNYLKKGFEKPPADYYLRPFGVAAEKEIGTHKMLNAKLCYGPRLTFEVLLDYMQKVAFTMGHDKRYFQFIWATSLTHDKLNTGRLGDEKLRSTLKWFLEEGHLNRTVFILMSDHGIRWGAIHSYLQGQLEERLPFMYFISPSWFQQKYKKAYDNLKLNQDRLTTFYDFHETLVDLLDLTQLDSDVISGKEQALELADKDKNLPRGISHFLPVPLSRTCEMAGIEEHYCTCHRLKEVETSQPEVEQAANFMVHEINTMVSHYPKCGYLSLENITIAHVIDFGFDVSKWKDEKGYELTVMTTPGNALFEASVMRNKTGIWRVSGTISRTNLYGNQSHCVDDKDIKLYCYCTDNLMR